MADPKPIIQYTTKTELLKIGNTSLTIQSLDNLDKTIDAVFDALQIHGNQALLEELCPYFGVIWPAALALSEWIADRPVPSSPSNRLLEIGCGLAIPSLIAHQRGYRVTATDFHPEVEFFLKRNLTLNHATAIEYCHVDWKTAGFDGRRFDWIIGSDILYEKGHPAWVAETIDRLLTENGTTVITDPARPYLQNFVDEMTKRGFQHAILVQKNIFILTLKRAELG